MNSHKIQFLPEPTLSHEAATKDYVDRKIDLLPILSYDGHIPPLEANTSKTGFIVHASSHYDGDHQPWMAFNSGRTGQWATSGEGAGAWIRIWCPTPVRIWKITLTGRASNRERITRWKLSAGAGSIQTLTDIHTSGVMLGSTMQEFFLDVHVPYNVYKLTALASEPGTINTGLYHFQVFTKSYRLSNVS